MSIYAYVDLNALTGLNMYRLKMVDRDGSFSYSEVVSVLMKKTSASSYGVAAARFTSNGLQLEVTSSKRQLVNVRLTDVSGKVLAHQSLQLETGLNTFRKNIFLGSGIYYLQMKNEEGGFARALRHL